MLKWLRLLAFVLCLGLALGVLFSAALLDRFGLGLGAVLIVAALVYWVSTILDDTW